jgi:hypothetical protein
MLYNEEIELEGKKMEFNIEKEKTKRRILRSKKIWESEGGGELVDEYCEFADEMLREALEKLGVKLPEHFNTTCEAEYNHFYLSARLGDEEICTVGVGYWQDGSLFNRRGDSLITLWSSKQIKKDVKDCVKAIKERLKS